MDDSMRVVIIAGVLMLALLVAIVGSVSADSVSWHASNMPGIGSSIHPVVGRS